MLLLLLLDVDGGGDDDVDCSEIFLFIVRLFKKEFVCFCLFVLIKAAKVQKLEIEIEIRKMRR